MDVLEEYLTAGLHYYNRLFPYFSPYNSYLSQALSYLSPYNSYLSQALSYLSPYLPFAQSGIHSLSSYTNNILNEPPDLGSVLVIVAAFVIGLKILGFLKRLVIGWVVFFFQLAFWAVVAALALWVYARGVDQTLEDVTGWGKEVTHVWGKEKSRWEEVARQAGQGRGYARGTGRWT